MKSWIILLNLVAVVYVDDSVDMSCCNLTLMDSAKKVIIDDTELTPGVYNAVQVRFCNQKETTLMIWKKLDRPATQEPEYELVWSYKYTPKTAEVQTMAFTVIDLAPDNNITIAANMYLGIHVPFADKLTIPYLFDEKYKMRVSMAPMDGFAVGDTVMVDMVTWPRSIQPYFALCPYEGCPKKSIPQVPGGPVGPQGPPGVPGTPGENGGLIPDLGDITCDIGSDTKDTVNTVDSTTKEILEELKTLRFKVDELTKETTVNALCPPGYDQGDAGTGSCYKFFFSSRVSFAEAIINCRNEQNYGATLVSISTETEYNYIKAKIREKNPTMNRQDIWTSGMYSMASGNWVWKGNSGDVVMDWTIWAPDSETGSRRMQCQVLRVNLETGEAMNYAVDCAMETAFYICEIDKRCM